MSSYYYLERISKRIWKIVDSDPFGQYPFIYLIEAIDKFIVIDTGTGHRNIVDFIKSKFDLSSKGNRVLVILTHVHFDHVGGVSHFLEDQVVDVVDVCMSGASKTFSCNVEINSLALAHRGARVGAFEVTRWLADGDVVYLDDEHPSDDMAIRVLETPGHTPDSIALYYQFGEKRIFIGDTLYPFTAVHVDCLGSDVNDYKNTITKLKEFVSSIQNDEIVVDDMLVGVGTETKPVEHVQGAASEVPVVSAYSDQIAMFQAIIGESGNFSIEGLMEMCNGDVESAVNFYFGNGDLIYEMFPLRATPVSTGVSSDSSSPYGMEYEPFLGDVRFSCGHVEANLDPGSLDSMSTALDLIEQGFITPSHIDSGYGEYTVENFTIMLPLKK